MTETEALARAQSIWDTHYDREPVYLAFLCDIAAELRKESERAEAEIASLREALREWLALADHQGLSSSRHRQRTRELIRPKTETT